MFTAPTPALLAASALLLASSCRLTSAAAADEQAIYDAKLSTGDPCDYFVSFAKGSDKNEGTDIAHPFQTLKCACDPECNTELQQDEVICMLAEVHEVTDTVYVKGAGMREKGLRIIALGSKHSAVLDGLGQVSLFNALQTKVEFEGIVFTNGNGASGGAVYGERDMKFTDCIFKDNEASVHGGAVMGGRNLEFNKCEFRDNKARFAGAVRVNDLGKAQINDCLFIGNKAEGRGGALITQIEKPENTVKVSNTLFCFNESPMSPNIYNYRTITHECKKCKFNSKECCSNHGRMVGIEDATNFVVPDGLERARVCQCNEGWSGERCEAKATDSPPQKTPTKTEL